MSEEQNSTEAEQHPAPKGKVILFHVIGLLGTLAVAMVALTLNAWIAMGRIITNLKDEPTLQNLEMAGVTADNRQVFLIYLVIAAVVAGILIFIWHRIRRQLGLTFGGSMFYLLLYAIATFFLALIIITLRSPIGTEILPPPGENG